MGLNILPVLGKGKEEDILKSVKKFAEKINDVNEVFRDCVKFWLDEDYDTLLDKVDDILALEHDADEIVHDITLKMYGGAFLPGTRSHLHELVDRLDDVIDEVQHSVEMFQYTEKKRIPENIKSSFWKLADETRKCVEKFVVVIDDFLENDDKLMDHIKEAKSLEHNCDVLKKEVLELVYFGKKEAVTNTLLAQIANHIAAISDAVEMACQKVIVLKLLKQA